MNQEYDALYFSYRSVLSSRGPTAYLASDLLDLASSYTTRPEDDPHLTVVEGRELAVAADTYGGKVGTAARKVLGEYQDALAGAVALASLAGAIGAASPFEPGPFARGSIPASQPGTINAAEQLAINKLGAQFGCHTCGTFKPGTKSGNWVGDHLPVSRFARGMAQRFFPQCKTCMRIQGLAAIKALKEGIDPYASLRDEEEEP